MEITILPTLPPMPKLTRVAAYARVSSGKDAMLHSLATQVSYYNRYIQSAPGWNFAGVYADEAVTGTKDNRPDFQRMLQDCRNGKIDIILTKSISRFARNTLDLLATVRELKRLGVGVRFEEQGIDTMSADGEVMLTILASYAQEESRSVSENCKWRIRKRFAQGELVNLRRMYGYRIENGRFGVHPAQAAIVRRIFQEYVAGETVQRIAERLRQEHVPTVFSGGWGQDYIRTILKNEKYLGNALLQKTFIADHLTKKKQKNKGELPMYLVEGTHPAIIDEVTFALAQEIMEKNRQARNTQKATTARYPFSGMIKCENCGKSYRRWDTHKRLKWQCSTYITLGKKYCPAKQIPDAVLRTLTCEVLNIASFDASAFREKVKEIWVPSANRIVFRLSDGRSVEKVWKDRSRSNGWTDKMRTKARETETRRRCHD